MHAYGSKQIHEGRRVPHAGKRKCDCCTVDAVGKHSPRTERTTRALKRKARSQAKREIKKQLTQKEEMR